VVNGSCRLWTPTVLDLLHEDIEEAWISVGRRRARQSPAGCDSEAMFANTVLHLQFEPWLVASSLICFDRDPLFEDLG
jgi:hypothetical protein